MIALFRYCFNRSALNRNYVATVAGAWNKSKIQTFADLDAYFQKQEKLSLQCKDIKKKLRLTRNLSMFEEAYVEKWIMNYGYDSNVIDLALMKTTSKSNPSFEYIDKLISDWHERNFKTADQIKKYLENKKTMPVQKDTKSSKDSKTVNHSFKNLSDFYVNTDEDE
jgi:DnaD/phage-associated family protein